jgi:putative endonuclease
MHCTERRDGRSRRGRLAEHVAAAWLRAHGWSLLGRHLRVAGVEVDLAATDGRRVLVVEVKSRSPGRTADAVTGWELVSAGQLHRLERAAEILQRRHGLPARVELIEIRWGAWPFLRWHRELESR